MKYLKKVGILLLVATMMVSMSACGNEKKDDTKKENVANEDGADYFVWYMKGGLGELTEEGLKQEKIVIPQECERLMGIIVTKDSNIKQIEFEGTVNADFDAQSLVEAKSSIETVIYPEGMTKLSGLSLSFEDNLTTIKFPSTLTEIQANAVNCCNKLEKVDLEGTSVEKIEENAFQKCESLKEVRLPKTLKELGEYAFPYGVTDVYVPADMELMKYSDTNFPYTDEGITVHLTKDSWADQHFDEWFGGTVQVVREYEN